MIGHWLLALTREEEDTLLTTALRPGSYHHDDKDFCLVGALLSRCYGTEFLRRLRRSRPDSPQPVYYNRQLHKEVADRIETRYDALCARYGTARVNGWVRDRILEHRAMRELAGVKDLAGVA